MQDERGRQRQGERRDLCAEVRDAEGAPQLEKVAVVCR